MKYIIIGAIIICVIIITNLVTCVTTYGINDYLWREHTAKIEYKIFVAMHRTCMKNGVENSICNTSAQIIYDSYRKNYNPLPGFDWDFIIEQESY